jgi:olefin beta-lactone synthetase
MTSSHVQSPHTNAASAGGFAADEGVNIASRLDAFAAAIPDQCAIAQHVGRHADGSYRYEDWSFRELNEQVERLAAGLIEQGVGPGKRLVLFVPFSREFVALTFAILRTGAVVVLIDPGMGRQNVFRCLQDVDPDGFVAISKVHAVRVFKRRMFPRARLNVTLGRRWFWGGTTYRGLIHRSRTSTTTRATTATSATDPAAIIFTSGSTGPPKGVCYEHAMFVAQVELIQQFYGITPGEIDLPGFPLFGLFNAAMGVTTVIPDMDPTRPAEVDPAKILQHIRDRRVTQAFGSPAFWNRIGRHCEQHSETLPTIMRALSAGGPVPVHVLERMQRALTAERARLHTPYGATECLPVASIDSQTVLNETAQQTRAGAGTCVGTAFDGVEIDIIPLTDEPIRRRSDVPPLATGEIGEIIVRSPSATREYFENPQATALAKIPDDTSGWWHRMGDVGYFDEQSRLWFCGRKAHIVETPAGLMYPVRCEAIINEDPRIYRSALVGVGRRPDQRPVIIVEPEAGAFPETESDRDAFVAEVLQRAAGHPLTSAIRTVLFHRSLPVDPRHNVKLNREELAQWAAGQLGSA